MTETPLITAALLSRPCRPNITHWTYQFSKVPWSFMFGCYSDSLTILSMTLWFRLLCSTGHLSKGGWLTVPYCVLYFSEGNDQVQVHHFCFSFSFSERFNKWKRTTCPSHPRSFYPYRAAEKILLGLTTWRRERVLFLHFLHHSLVLELQNTS
jgi:hypothetical protein